MRANPIRTKVKGKEAKCSKCKVGQTQLLIRIKLITFTCDRTEDGEREKETRSRALARPTLRRHCPHIGFHLIPNPAAQKGPLTF